MLKRYQIVRGKRPPEAPLPEGMRIDVRKHTRHVLAPSAAAVTRYLALPSSAAFRRFSADYARLLQQRFRERRREFDELAAAATDADVNIGCNCPTKTNPDVRRCHTTLALKFMKEKYPSLKVVLPRPAR